MRRTTGQYLARGSTPAGKAASSRACGCSHAKAMDCAVCGAYQRSPRRGTRRQSHARAPGCPSPWRGYAPRTAFGEGVSVNQQDGVVRGRTSGAAHQGHRLSRGGALIEHGRVGGGHACQAGNHCLEIQQRLEPARGNFGLVGPVGGVPGRAFQHVALHHTRGLGAEAALADKGLVDSAFARQRLQLGPHHLLRHGGRQSHRRRRVVGFGQRGRGKLLQRSKSKGTQHMMNVGLRSNPNVTVAKNGRHTVVGVLPPGQIYWGVCQWVHQVANVPRLV